ncbi:cysteine desulfurase [Luteitalea sp. TBR-22]|uniref:cysteine desulfurase family protein n=1 Tax=Luteitalea sp. TBR-22 TaxID=2802971 RepID=UPI001AFB7332|nr:cysteine desulfurase family protein [Luteitalea sp. TBR-22]BCS33709.1 cysteine desulfurase [Luteitalea sp. TBR-22]
MPAASARIYLDHNATTPVDPLVIEAVTRALRDDYGNASSVHHFGQMAKSRLDDARQEIAALIGGSPTEVVFTSGGTEADNFALRGAAEALEPLGKRHLVVSAIEHEAVLTTARALERRGWRVSRVAAGRDGVVDPDAVASALTDDTALLSLMHANNEVGTLQPVAACAALAHARGILVHTDAVQSAGKAPIDVTELDVDLLSLSAHKLYGPKGVGALWIRRGTRLVSPMTGGKQERSRRAGTENVPGIVGFGVAARLARERLASDAATQAALRNRLETEILARVPGTHVNGGTVPRVPNTSSIGFEGVEAESLLIALDLEGIAVSTGSACSSGTLEPSHVLKAMGLSLHDTQNALRFSLGRHTTDDEIGRVLDVVPGLVERLRSLTDRRAPLASMPGGA